MTFGITNISSLQFSMFNRQNVQSTTLALQRAGQELATGRKADIFADLGSNAVSTIKLRAREADTQTYMKSNDVLGNKLETMLLSVDTARDSVNSVLERAVTNASRPHINAEALQRDAIVALDKLVAVMNTKYNGDHLFSGVNSEAAPLVQWSQTNATTGLSPKDAIASIFAGGPTDAASAAALTGQIDLAFASNDAGNPNRNFEATMYQGTPALDGGGQPNDQLKAWVNVGHQVSYGVRANDDAFVEAYKGLSMLAVTDVSTMDEDAYATYMDSVITALGNAQDGMIAISSQIGFTQQIVETAQTQLTDVSLIQRTQIGTYENVDPYEAATRVQSLEIQLQASYEVTSRLSGLSILNFLR
ncbi:flagellin [Sulfitobacter geojensis]|uniref:flagellin n=1 Tax=Sulfitobacter geojensis TaxID=1342299 RepID=UPI002492A746|nr:flagellin [Sulfitobacter geojensis]